jgi:hypothetical protein
LDGRRIFWNFLVTCKIIDQRVKKSTGHRGEYAEYISNLFAVACSFPGRAKDLPAPSLIEVITTVKWLSSEVAAAYKL